MLYHRPMKQQQGWILWSAFLLAQVVFGAVGVFAGPAEGDGALVVPLVAVALGEAVASLAFGRLFGPSNEPTATMVRWALAEAVGLTGLVIRMTAGPTLAAPALMVAAFVLILAQPPRAPE